MESQLFIFGHRNPDTDSICSSIAYAQLKRELGFSGANAYKLDELNQETQFLLDYFGVPSPPLLHDVKLQLKDLNLYKPLSIFENEPLKKAWDALNESKGSRIIPILDASNEVKGLIGVGDLMKIFMEVSDEEVVKRHEILYDNLISILNGKQIFGKYNYEKLDGALYIGTNYLDAAKICDKDIIITGKIDSAWKIAYELNCGCLILTNGIKPIGLDSAKCAVVTVEHTMFKTVSLVNQAISIRSVMQNDNIITFSEDGNIDDIIEIMKTSSHRNFPVVNSDGVLVGILSRRHLIEYNAKKVILVDHNERSQSVEGLEQAEIVEIIDHHRVADIQTNSPLYIRSEPVGCTATIIFKMYNENNVAVKKEIAGLLLGAILSDTLMFNSPTCTNEDRKSAAKLAEIAQVNVEEFGRKMFLVSTSVDKYTPEQILSIDRKRFLFGKNIAYISQINTIDFEGISHRQDEMFAAMEKFYKESGCDLVMLMVTDIVAEGSEIMAVGRGKTLLHQAFGMKAEQRSVFIDGVVSRKKQVVPKLTQAVYMF